MGLQVRADFLEEQRLCRLRLKDETGVRKGEGRQEGPSEGVNWAKAWR